MEERRKRRRRIIDQPVNMVDFEKEYNKKIETNKPIDSFEKETVIKKNRANIIFLSIMLAIFTLIAVSLIVNANVEKPWMRVENEIGEMVVSSNTLKIGIVLLVFLFPFYLWLFLVIIENAALKRNKQIKGLSIKNYILPLSTVLALGIFPIIFIEKLEDLKNVAWIIWYSFIGLVLLFIIFYCIRALISKHTKNKLLDNPTLVPIKAKYIGCKFSSSTISTVNSMPTRLSVMYQIIFSYEDEKGIMRTRTSNEEFTFKEVQYLKYKQQFDILAHKRKVAIVEDLKNIELPENMEIDLDDNDSLNPEQAKQKALPAFARKNYWQTSFKASIIFSAVFLSVGVALLFIIKQALFFSLFCLFAGVLIFVVLMLHCVPSMLAEKKGEETCAKLLRLEVGRPRGEDRERVKYAIVLLNGETRSLMLLHDEWFAILGEYIEKDIPVKVYKKTIIIDFERLYSNKI